MNNQLISYIAPGAPATRRPAGIESNSLAFLRPEIGFTPRWYSKSLGIVFDERWHSDPSYRKQTRIAMAVELEKRFPEKAIGRNGDGSLDLLTGTYGASAIAAIYGVPIRYDVEQWPISEHKYLTEQDIDNLTPPDLENNPFFNSLMNQVQWIADNEGKINGYMNWQGVLNNAQRLRGQDIFMDMFLAPERTMHLFECVSTTMIEAAKIVHREQNKFAAELSFFTLSNCLVNMVDPGLYEEFLLPFDQKIAAAFDVIGIHNCAWSATPYLDSYSKIHGITYLDMGQDSDLLKTRDLFPDTRRAIMYTPMELDNKPLNEIRKDLNHIAAEYGPCDIVAADIEHGTPDNKILEFIDLCKVISNEY